MKIPLSNPLSPCWRMGFREQMRGTSICVWVKHSVYTKPIHASTMERKSEHFHCKRHTIDIWGIWRWKMTEFCSHWAYILGDQHTQHVSASAGQMLLIMQWEYRSIQEIPWDDTFDSYKNYTISLKVTIETLLLLKVFSVFTQKGKYIFSTYFQSRACKKNGLSFFINLNML